MENAQETFQSMNKQNGDEATLSIGENNLDYQFLQISLECLNLSSNRHQVSMALVESEECLLALFLKRQGSL